MDIQKLFNTQRDLDARILEKHPELKGQNNLDWKLLALQVELGECANEWRGFKKWSNDQEPRTKLFTWIDGLGQCVESKNDPRMLVENGQFNAFRVKNPLLEEYVDCLHFILSIGLEEVEWYGSKEEIRYIAWKEIENGSLHDNDIISQFNGLFLDIGTLYDATVDRAFDYQTIEDAYGNVLRTFIGLGEKLGFTWEQIEEAYYAKNKVNHERQENNY